MDLAKVIRDLRQELRRVKTGIAALEALHSQPAHATPRRRGRKSTEPEERRRISQRMRLYWAARKKEEKGQTAPELPDQ